MPSCGIAVLSASITVSKLSPFARWGRKFTGRHKWSSFRSRIRKGAWSIVGSWSTANHNSGNEFALLSVRANDILVASQLRLRRHYLFLIEWFEHPSFAKATDG